MINPFEEILNELKDLKDSVSALHQVATQQDQIEVIDRNELCKRLSITEPTVIRWEKKGKIPALKVGSSIRYNWPAVIKALETK
jgi:excisionase family DNA binding protein